jgi:hypothetical protein
MKITCVYVQVFLFVFVATPTWCAEERVVSQIDPRLGYYLFMDNDKRSYSDIALVNLLIAQGLPGAENIDIDQCLSTLREWARLAEQETEKEFPLFHKNPQNFKYSEGYFRTLVLLAFLSLNAGIRYDPALISTPSLDDLKSTAFFRNAENIFIHGIINKRLGTCSSIPVLVVSLGRLMGYPLRLVNAKAHLFVRWEGEKDRFNIEFSGDGFASHPDAHYMKWPFEITEDELKTGFFLKSLSPTEEIATFLEGRAMCLLENNRDDEAYSVFRYAYLLYPNHPYLKGYIESFIEQ